MNRIDLADKCAVITGGSGGIGLATARRMVASGARVILWDLNQASLDAAAASVLGVSGVQVDVTDPEAVAAATAESERLGGRIDILVNAAGVEGIRSTVAAHPIDAWHRIVNVNLHGTFLPCRAVVPVMERNGYGRIVNLASVAGKEGTAYGSAYAVAKAAVIALTKSLAKEVIAQDIRVNCVTPAVIDTDLFKRMGEERQKAATARVPMGRPGQPDEVAAMVCWLASAECSYSTGAAFDLSGGRATY